MITNVKSDVELRALLSRADSSQLIVVEYMATWSSPCQDMASFYESLSTQYHNVRFMMVDVEKCREATTTERIATLPTFVFYRNDNQIGRVRANNKVELEAKIKEFGGVVFEKPSAKAAEAQAEGHINLLPHINMPACECLNDSDSHPFKNCLDVRSGPLKSDVDEQLILSFGFIQAVKLHSLKIQAPAGNGPKTLKLFINQPRTLDFDQAESMEPVQTIVLEESDLLEDNFIPLRYVKYQNVQNFQIFVKDNQGKSDVTQINYIQIYGSPINMTNMSDFKRVAGKKGESH